LIKLTKLPDHFSPPDKLCSQCLCILSVRNVRTCPTIKPIRRNRITLNIDKMHGRVTPKIIDNLFLSLLPPTTSSMCYFIIMRHCVLPSWLTWGSCINGISSLEATSFSMFTLFEKKAMKVPISPIQSTRANAGLHKMWFNLKRAFFVCRAS